MKRILQYFKLCILFNILITCGFFAIKHNTNENIISKALDTISFVNIAKIIIQFVLTRRIHKRQEFKKELNFDRIMDLFKLAYFTYMFIEIGKFFVNNYMYLVYFIIGINYFIIFIQFMYNLVYPPAFVYRNPIPLFVVNEQQIYINFNNTYTIYKASTSNNITCPICLDEQTEGEEWGKLTCNHEFHEKCIKGWLNNNRTCPTCRNNI
jgi:hypothetical protein